MKEYYLDIVVDSQIATYSLVCTLEGILDSVEPSSGYLGTYQGGEPNSSMLNFTIVAERYSQVQVARNAIEDYFLEGGIDCTHVSTTYIRDLTTQ